MFRFSKPEVEGPLNVSKWLNVQVLLDSSEIRDLFSELGDFLIVPVGCVVARDNPTLSRDSFLKVYDEYVEDLKSGNQPKAFSYLAPFSCALSLGPEEFYAMEVSPKNMLTKPILPVVQMQAHSMGYSMVDESIYPMVRGSNVIAWGIQFSFPTLFQAKKQKEPSNTLADEGFRNAKLFQMLQKWMRLHSRPTPLMIRQRRLNIPVRIGHQCFSWVNNHAMLRFHGLMVENEGDEG